MVQLLKNGQQKLELNSGLVARALKFLAVDYQQQYTFTIEKLVTFVKSLGHIYWEKFCIKIQRK
jgi:hypothetical protein